MDFSGHAGRVIENPREALSAALEEAQAWRVRGPQPSACLSWGPCVCVCVFKKGEGQRKQERERLLSKLYTQHGAQLWAQSPHPEIMT